MLTQDAQEQTFAFYVQQVLLEQENPQDIQSCVNELTNSAAELLITQPEPVTEKSYILLNS